MYVCVFGPNSLQGTSFMFQIAQVDTYDESKLSTVLFGIIVVINAVPQNAFCVFSSACGDVQITR